MQLMTIIRGLPGSGKTTLAKKIAKQKNAVIHSTDSFWLCEDGQYRYDPERIKEAHLWNQQQCETSMRDGKNVIIDNCNVKKEHVDPYLELAKKYNAKVSIVISPLNDEDLELLFYNNTHNVPYHIIEQMRQDWEQI